MSLLAQLAGRGDFSFSVTRVGHIARGHPRNERRVPYESIVNMLVVNVGGVIMLVPQSLVAVQRAEPMSGKLHNGRGHAETHRG